MQLFFSRLLRLGAVAALVALIFSNAAVRAAVSNATSGIDLSSLDRTCKPCSDFYQFANGNWIKINPIPQAYPSCGSFYVLQ